jgi:dUTP pyrophosphatase
MFVKVIKFDNYKAPNRAHYNDSGADIYAAETVVIGPGQVAAIPTGVGVELPDGYDIVVHCKSGFSKKGIWASNAPVDAGYRGQIHAILYNTTKEPFTVEEGTKVGQLVMRPVLYPVFVDSLDNSRGEGAFGSTGMY